MADNDVDSSTDAPCRTCGSTEVTMREGRLLGTLGQPEGQPHQYRVCLNRGCRTNNTRTRRLADVV